MSRETFFFLNCAGRCVPERAPPGVGLWDEMKDGGGDADRQAGRQAAFVSSRTAFLLRYDLASYLRPD